MKKANRNGVRCESASSISGSVLEGGAGKQNGGTLFAALFRTVGTRMEKLPLNFYAPNGFPLE
jgi:hypothetical protein